MALCPTLPQLAMLNDNINSTLGKFGAADGFKFLPPGGTPGQTCFCAGDGAGVWGDAVSPADLAELKARLKALELADSGEITSNQFAVIFNDLDDVTLSSGVWDQPNAALVF